MAKRSAGLLLFRRFGAGLEVFLVHPGGPFWARKDEGAWSIPKGEYEPGEDPLATARREFAEETGISPPASPTVGLGEVVQAGRKVVTCFAAEGDADPAAIASNVFDMEWPPRSGRRRSFPEVDRAGWFPPEAARAKLVAGQVPFLDRLERHLAPDGAPPEGDVTPGWRSPPRRAG